MFVVGDDVGSPQKKNPAPQFFLGPHLIFSLLMYLIFSAQMDLQSEVYLHFNERSLMENTLLYSSPTKEERIENYAGT